MCGEWLTEEYQLSNRATPAASVDNILTKDDPGLKDYGVDETTGVHSDFFHRQYDSPIKQKLVQHIQEQDAEIEHLNKRLTWSNSPLLKLRENVVVTCKIFGFFCLVLKI